MRKYKKREIVEYIRTGLAKDITSKSFEEVEKLNLCRIGLSFGKYGMNAGLFQDVDTGDFYVVRERNSLLFMLA